MLTVMEIDSAKPRAKTWRLHDQRGLYLEVTPTGGRRWRFKYSFGGKEKRLSLGVYPDVPLKLARERRELLRQSVAAGVDPSVTRKQEKRDQIDGVKDSFEAIAREWFDRFSPNWDSRYAGLVIRRLEAEAFPWLGTRKITAIKPVELLTVLRRIEKRGALETAHRVMQYAGKVFRYAVATSRAERDITVDLRGALPPTKERHHATQTNPKSVAELLRAIEGYEGAFVTKCALRLSPMLFVRQGELRQAEWSEIDIENAEWRIPAARMKMRAPHIVPLSRQAIDVLRELQAVRRNGKYVFPGAAHIYRPMSSNTVNGALRRLGYTNEEMTAHGFRSMASTLLNEHGWNRDAIERQLAHADRDSIRATYNYAEYLPERRRMMQWWADYLDALRNGTPLKSIIEQQEQVHVPTMRLA